jgi:hypothetical protein
MSLLDLCAAVPVSNAVLHSVKSMEVESSEPLGQEGYHFQSERSFYGSTTRLGVRKMHWMPSRKITPMGNETNARGVTP